MAAYYRTDVIAPIGLPLGEVQTQIDEAGNLLQYSIWMFGGMGDMTVFGPAPQPPQSPQSYEDAVPKNPDFVDIRRDVLQIRGSAGLLIQQRDLKYPYLTQFRILWPVAGHLVQLEVASAGFQGRYPTVGPDALDGVAQNVVSVPFNQVPATAIIQEDRRKPLAGEITTVSSTTDAAGVLGRQPIAPGQYSFIHVLRLGSIESYTIDLDPQGNRRLFLAGAPPPTAAADAAAPGVQVAQDVTVRGTPAVYEKIVTSAGATSLLYFHVGGTQMFLEDATGGSAQDLVAVAETVGTQQDAQAPTITVGAPSLVNGKVQVPVSTTGSGLAAYSGFNVHLRWTPGVFSFDSATNTATVIASPFCPAPVPDADGAGVLYACTALGGTSTTQAGLLGTISLTPATPGCSVLHLFTYGGADAGDDSTGTYTIDPATNTPQTLPTIDGSSDVRAQIC